MDAFWASLWGSLAGAAAGATAAWLFALDLRRRERLDQASERVNESTERYEDRMRELWASLAEGILNLKAASSKVEISGKYRDEWFAQHRAMLTITHRIQTHAEGDDGLLIWFVMREFAWAEFESDKASRIAAVLSMHATRKVDTDSTLQALINLAYPKETPETPVTDSTT